MLPRLFLARDRPHLGPGFTACQTQDLEEAGGFPTISMLSCEKGALSASCQHHSTDTDTEIRPPVTARAHRAGAPGKPSAPRFLKQPSHFTTWDVCGCVLSCLCRVQLFATLWTAACQAPLSMGLSRRLGFRATRLFQSYNWKKRGISLKCLPKYIAFTHTHTHIISVNKNV